MFKRFPKFKYPPISFSVVVMILIGSFLYFEPALERPSPSPVSIKHYPSPFSDRQDFQNILKLQSAFIRNARLIKPTVVSVNKIIDVVQKSSIDDHGYSHPKPWYFPIQKWFVNFVKRKQYRVENVGSGVILNSDGYVITNNHVIKNIDRVLVKLSNGRDYFAKVVGHDSMTDIAILKISSFRRLPYPEFGNSVDINVGEWVMAIGNPYGLEGTVTVGVVSGKGRNDLGITTYENFIQTDASINPGNSGGPLINLKGEIIGINTAVAEIGSGVGFAIPIEMVLKVAGQLVKTGEVERGWLGVGIQPLTPELADSFNLMRPGHGVLVNSVDKRTPAEKGGILQGDIIIQFDGKDVPSLKIFQHMVADTNVGKTVAIKVIRKGIEKKLKVKIGRLVS